MRCTWKVASRSGVIYADRHWPQFCSKDHRGVCDWANEVVDAWDKYYQGLAKEQENTFTAKQIRDSERAMRYDSWGYVRLQINNRWNDKGMLVVEHKLSIDLPNTEDSEVSGACENVARSIASIIALKKGAIDDNELKNRITWVDSPIIDEEWRREMEWQKQNEYTIDNSSAQQGKEAPQSAQNITVATSTDCPHQTGGNRCAIHEKGCPYFHNGLCEIAKRNY